MTEHVHELHFFEESKDGCFCVKGCSSRLSRDKAEDMLNEYETLKAANGRLRDRFELIGETVNTPDGKMTVYELFVQLDRACNDTLEGKDE